MNKLFQKLLTDTSKTIKEVTAPEILTDDGDAYSTLSKPTVLLEARCFNDKQINERKCRQLLARLVYLINQGEKFTESESTNLFFSITKLFQSENNDLRRMIYLIIREMAHESSIYIITASLTKDMNSKVDLFRMNALRLTPIIIEPQYLIQSERYIKQAIIDKNPAIACSALMAGVHLYPQNAEFVKKWTNEIQEKLNTQSPATHYHALILMREIRKQDKNSFLKILVNLSKDGGSNGIAAVQLIRFIREFVLSGELDSQNERAFVDFLNKQLHKSSDMVVFEAAKTLCEFKSLPNKELASTISVLNLFLNSASSINKFAALRIINKLISNPARISLITNNTEIENLLRDNNKSLSAFAISILLKVSKEESVEQLLGQIQEYISEASDEFKIDIVSSVKALAKKHPKKYKIIINFLASCLKNEGQYEFKSAVVSCLESVIQEIPESKELGLFTLVEFIEDCQYSVLQIQIMNLLAREASNILYPAKFVRLINNRVVLENADIRAAAVTTLGKFALEKHQLIPDVRAIISQALEDTDNEVRGRALYYIEEMDKIEQGESTKLSALKLSQDEVDQIEVFLQQNLSNLQRSSDPEALDITNIVNFIKENNIQITAKKEPAKKRGVQESAVELDNAAVAERAPTENAQFKKYQQMFSSSPHFEDIGQLRMVHDEKLITDAKAEYPVKLRKIFFDDYMVLEFSVSNALENSALSAVTVDLQFDSELLKTVQVLSINQIKTGESASIFVTLAKHPEYKIVTVSISSFLKFKITEFAADGKTKQAEYDDEYQLDDFQITVADYIQPVALPVDRSFDSVWKSLQGTEQDASYQLEYKTLDAAIKGLIKHFGMNVCDNSDVINMENKVHSLKLSGLYLGHEELLLNALIGFQPDRGCLMKLKAKSPDEALTASILECVN